MKSVESEKNRNDVGRQKNTKTRKAPEGGRGWGRRATNAFVMMSLGAPWASPAWAQEEDKVHVKLVSASLARNEVVVNLSPADATGTLILNMELGENQQTVHMKTIVGQGGGQGITIAQGFGNINDLPDNTTLDKIVAQWRVGEESDTDRLQFKIKVLSQYRHSQYNIPSESDATCNQGGMTTVYMTRADCSWEEATLPERFRAQVLLNGTGRSDNYGVIKMEAFCLRPANRPPDAPEGFVQGFVFRRNESENGACGAVGTTTVAVRQDHPDIACRRGQTAPRIFINTVGVKTVTDYCPGCVREQCDNFTLDARCAGINDLGNFKTIKLFQTAQ